MIVKAAIKFKGCVYIGRRHADIIRDMRTNGFITIDDKPVLQDQGFIDEKGVFYSRHAARYHAIKSGQIPPSFDSLLHSEDLWEGQES